MNVRKNTPQRWGSSGARYGFCESESFTRKITEANNENESFLKANDDAVQIKGVNMANHVRHQVQVRGPKVELDVVDAVFHAERPFDIIVPPGEELYKIMDSVDTLTDRSKLPPKNFNELFNLDFPQSYIWMHRRNQIEAGPYWITTNRVEKSKLEIIYYSRNSPLLRIIYELGSICENTRFEMQYSEPYAHYQGTYIIDKDKVIEDECEEWKWEYKLNPDFEPAETTKDSREYLALVDKAFQGWLKDRSSPDFELISFLLRNPLISDLIDVESIFDNIWQQRIDYDKLLALMKNLVSRAGMDKIRFLSKLFANGEAICKSPRREIGAMLTRKNP